MSREKESRGQSGGVTIRGDKVTVHGNIAGRDMTVGTEVPRAQLDSLFRPLTEVLRSAPSDKREEATQKVEALKTEVTKGKKADDRVMAKLVEGIVGLVPGAVSAVVSAFATPVLGGIAGPVTKYILDTIQGK
jgi:hypothetical protein